MVVYTGGKSNKSKPRKVMRIEYDGHMFDSILERDFYKAISDSGICEKIEVHKQLRISGTTRALAIDFVIHRKDGVIFYADTKAFWTFTPTFKFKRMILEQQMGVNIDVVLRNRAGKTSEAIDEIDSYVVYLKETDRNIGFNIWKKIRS